jgi:DNA-directed RNA polymerase subunit RPC12/RpoP
MNVKKLKQEGVTFLVYDIETLPLSADIFRLGKQFVSHNQLQPHRDTYDIITIQYKWLHEPKVHNLCWIGEEESSKGIIEKFDKIAKEATFLIGKNSDRFDVKHINTLRMIHGLDPFAEWSSVKISEDLEKQMRKHFYLPSNSLDYLSKMLFKSGKDKMEFADWQKIRNFKEVATILQDNDLRKNDKIINDIVYKMYGKTVNAILREGKLAQKKMIRYGNKDVSDTAKCWLKVLPYIKPRNSIGRVLSNVDGYNIRCKHCGSKHVHNNGKEARFGVLKQRFRCSTCKREAGMATILKNNNLGKMT